MDVVVVGHMGYLFFNFIRVSSLFFTLIFLKSYTIKSMGEGVNAALKTGETRRRMAMIQVGQTQSA